MTVKRTKQKQSKPQKQQLTSEAAEALFMFRGHGAAGEVAALNTPGSGGAVLQTFSEISEAVERVKSGDLSDVERVLTEQLFMMHALTRHSLEWYRATEMMPHRQLALKAVNQSSNGTRQIASALATMKRPKKVVFVDKQQNVMVNGSPQQQLGESTNAPMDQRSQKTAAPETAGAEAVVEIDRASD
ncbi:MAG: hypothetical protein AAGB19_18435 [Cyanobacteria bacterium P01_F01_bin.3]